VIRLGLRLTFASGREALGRVLVTASAIALGVGLLLASLAGVNGLHAQTVRGAWLDTSARATRVPSPSAALWWLASTDQFAGQAIDRIDVAAAGANAPVPPGMSHLPGPGGYFASPALASLLRSVPANQLRDRYPGHLTGIIGEAALPTPTSLIIVIGHHARQLSLAPGAVEVGSIQRTPASCYDCQNTAGSGSILEFILAAGAVALLLPILILIATASRLSSARREERFAAMRLIGATPRQITTVAAVEASVAAIAGVAVGFVVFFLVRPLLYHVAFTGAPLATGDLSINVIDIALVALGVPVAAIISARLALRKVQASPLGVQRKGSTRAPRLIRVVPLLSGISLLAYFAAVGKPGTVGSQLLELLAGFVLLIVGLVVAGPWITTSGSRLMATRARRATTLLAGRRLLDDPKAAFRFVTGLVVALFVASVMVGALSSVDAVATSSVVGAARSTIATEFCNFTMSHCPPSTVVPAVSDQVMGGLHATRGVRAVTLVHQSPAPPAQSGRGGSSALPFELVGYVVCAQLAKTPAIGSCAPGASVASIGYFFSNLLGHTSHAATTVWPTSSVTTAQLSRMPLSSVVVATNGTSGSIERARTSLERAFPWQGTPVSVEGLKPTTARLLSTIQTMTNVVIVASLIIAACSLAVNIAAGLGERKRPFSLLRLAGVPMATLYRVVTVEGALPLVLTATVSIIVGLASAALYLHSQVGIAFHVPGIGYWTIILAGMAASLAIIASTFPLLKRMTGPEVARNE